MATVKLAPSILAADFARLGEQVAEAEAAGADRIHVDVMDGHFVPNISIGVPVVRSLRKVTRLPLETHLMIADAPRYLVAFAEAGSDTLIVHQEAVTHLHRAVQQMKQLGRRAGVAINPATPVVLLEDILDDLDLLLVMTVNPGFGGQEFIPSTLTKIRLARQLLDTRRLSADLEVDGGIEPHTAPQAVAAGATVLVAGTAIFRQADGVAAAMQRMRRSCGDAA
jgi:ribulose-phosphate 3-epimerase